MGTAHLPQNSQSVARDTWIFVSLRCSLEWQRSRHQTSRPVASSSAHCARSTAQPGHVHKKSRGIERSHSRRQTSFGCEMLKSGTRVTGLSCRPAAGSVDPRKAACGSGHAAMISRPRLPAAARLQLGEQSPQTRPRLPCADHDQARHMPPCPPPAPPGVPGAGAPASGAQRGLVFYTIERLGR
jgi:hypothetical protein